VRVTLQKLSLSRTEEEPQESLLARQRQNQSQLRTLRFALQTAYRERQNCLTDLEKLRERELATISFRKTVYEETAKYVEENKQVVGQLQRPLREINASTKRLIQLAISFSQGRRNSSTNSLP
jgi:hypothetical protein